MHYRDHLARSLQFGKINYETKGELEVCKRHLSTHRRGNFMEFPCGEIIYLLFSHIR
jgi:hypothetical protein